MLVGSADSPIDLVYGHDLRNAHTRQQVLEEIRTKKPDLITLESEMWALESVPTTEPQHRSDHGRSQEVDIPLVEVRERSVG